MNICAGFWNWFFRVPTCSSTGNTCQSRHEAEETAGVRRGVRVRAVLVHRHTDRRDLCFVNVTVCGGSVRAGSVELILTWTGPGTPPLTTSKSWHRKWSIGFVSGAAGDPADGLEARHHQSGLPGNFGNVNLKDLN